jgi:sulfoxide reductase heme-binding subunit YedZ
MRTVLKSLVFGLALVPLGWLAFTVVTGRTSPNPAQDIIDSTGIWALRFLLITLAITPLRRLTGVNVVIQYRRMLGLFAFFYACVHLFSYMGFDRLFDVGGILSDVARRPFITAGMTALAVMIPLAVTSTKGWIRRLGRRWQTLHRLVYLGAVVACLHFVWKARALVGEPVYSVAILAALLGVRVLWRLRSPGRLRPRAPGIFRRAPRSEQMPAPKAP